MIAAKVENGIVVDAIVVEVIPSGWVALPDHVGIGMAIDAPEPLVVPASVPMRSARIVLHRHGYLATVDAAISAIGGEAAIDWEFASTVVRASVLVAQMAALLQIDDAAVDALFVEADAIV